MNMGFNSISNIILHKGCETYLNMNNELIFAYFIICITTLNIKKGGGGKLNKCEQNVTLLKHLFHILLVFPCQHVGLNCVTVED